MDTMIGKKEIFVSKISSKEVLFTLFIVLCFFMVYLHLKVELLEIGYEIADNRSQEKEIKENNYLLKANFLNLKSPQRIEPLAIEMGLRYPIQQDIVYIDKNDEITAKIEK